MNFGELFNYPFHANVWGTFSDWIMVIVTTLTAWYLVKTFRSQKEVQKLQQSLTTIEIRRYIDEIMPDISCSVHYTTDNVHYIYLTIQRRIPSRLQYTFTILSPDFSLPNGKVGRINTDNLHVLNSAKIPFEFNFNEVIDHIALAYLKVNYYDEIGTNYEVVFNINSGSSDVLKKGPFVKSFSQLEPRL